ncbi:MAG: TonB family protein [Candidatus Omnitrophota bacterium]|nr:MAG: TonB family protein [Candidatus Omnitrophota bacterium]
MKRYRNTAIIVSGALHVCFLTGIPSFLVSDSSFDSAHDLSEVELISQKTLEPKAGVEFREARVPPPFIDNFMEKLMVDNQKFLSFDKPQVLDQTVKGIILTEIPQEVHLRKIPAYMDYYRLIREKIRGNAYRYYHTRDRGEVFLSFVIRQNGHIEGLHLNRGSASNGRLRKIALESVKDAAPFPAFPDELTQYARLQFNISIHFKNN